MRASLVPALQREIIEELRPQAGSVAVVHPAVRRQQVEQLEFFSSMLRTSMIMSTWILKHNDMALPKLKGNWVLSCRPPRM